jgi:hypothetical protein
MKRKAFHEWQQQLGRTGNIGPVSLGMTRSELRALFGIPDDVGSSWRRQKEPLIWRYGEVEFHFSSDANRGLVLIYAEEGDGAVRLSIPPADRGAESDQ